MEEIKTYNSYKRFTHILQDEINSVFKLLKDYNYHLKINQFLKCDLEYLLGSNTWDVGNIFKLTFNQCLSLLLTSIEIINEEKYKRIAWNIKDLNTNIIFTYNINCYLSTIDLWTVIEFEIDYSENIRIPKPIQDLFDVDKINFFHKLEIFLKSSISNTQTDTVLINSSRDEVWDVISDWVEFQKRVPLIADRVIYQCEDKMLGSSLIIQKDNMSQCKLKVVLVENDADSFIWEFGLDCSQSQSNIPDQHIRIQVERLEKELTLLTFTHEFRTNISAKLLKALSKEKRKILRSLKASFI
jgi:hypothetical protein